MEREVRYCTTSDGVDIAYWTVGSGAPLVYIAEPVLTSSEGDYKLEKTRKWFEALADGRMLVRFDHRGTGLSHHNKDFTLEALRSDLEAVVDKLGLSSFDLWGDMDGGIVASSYAAAHTDRVRRLILFNSWARVADIPEDQTLQTVDKLIDLNWGLWAHMAATMDSGWTSGEAEEYSGYVRAGCEPAVARKFVDATWEYDVTPVLGQITCPTLVIHRRGHKYFPLSLGRTLAAGIPGARLTAVEGESFYPWFEHAETILKTALGFLDEGADRDAELRRAPAMTQGSGSGEVRYCTTADGVQLAYRIDGAGPFVILASNFISISQLPGGAITPLAEMIRQQFTVVRYDLRGMGLSDRDAMDYSQETRLQDLLAIANCVGAERFVLIGDLYSAAVSVGFAARYPERVDRLVLRDPFTNGERYYAETDFGKVAIATTGITVEQWEFISGTIMARGAAPGTTAEEIKRRGESLRASWSPEGLLASREAIRKFDITDALPKVRAKTMVVQTSDQPAMQKFTREIAAAIPDARLLVGSLERGAISDGMNRQVAEFVGMEVGEVPAASDAMERSALEPGHAMTAILFTDIADSTALTERLGDTRFRELSRALDTELRAAIHASGGESIEGKLLGDGVLATFGSAAQAIDGALRCLALSAASELGLHIGLHAGDVIREENADGRRDVFGGAVNIASRVCGLSAPGEILVSDVVRGMARSSAGVEFEYRGEQEMKGVGEPVRVFAVRGS